MKLITKIDIRHSNTLIDYQESLEFMENRVNNICHENERELIWFLNHDNIYTLGTSGNTNQVNSKIDIPIFNTNRGGKITYHGPGQRIVYFMIDLKKRKKDIRKFVSLIEKSAINVLKEFDIEAKTFPDKIGIWVTKNKSSKLLKEEKIGAIGLRLKKWVTYHGLSFNIDTNLDYYKNINACGLLNYSSTSLKKLGVSLSQNEFDKLYLKYFLKDLKIL